MSVQGDDLQGTHKKVDESWKEQIAREKEMNSNRQPTQETPQSNSRPDKASGDRVTSQPFLTLLSSLSYQAMMHLGEIPNPETQTVQVNLEAAKEVIDLLVALKEKSQGHLSSEEIQVFTQVLPGLQLRYAQSL